MEVELQNQDFRSIENMETNLRLQKNEVCVYHDYSTCMLKSNNNYNIVFVRSLI